MFSTASNVGMWNKWKSMLIWGKNVRRLLQAFIVWYVRRIRSRLVLLSSTGLRWMKVRRKDRLQTIGQAAVRSNRCSLKNRSPTKLILAQKTHSYSNHRKPRIQQPDIRFLWRQHTKHRKSTSQRMSLPKNILLKIIEILKHAHTVVGLSYLIGCKNIWKCAMLKNHSRRSERSKIKLQWKLSYRPRKEHRNQLSRPRNYGKRRLRSLQRHWHQQEIDANDQKLVLAKEDKPWMNSPRRKKNPARKERSPFISPKTMLFLSMTLPSRIQMKISNLTFQGRIQEVHKTCHHRTRSSDQAISWMLTCPEVLLPLKKLKTRRIPNGGKNVKYSNKLCKFQRR